MGTSMLVSGGWLLRKEEMQDDDNSADDIEQDLRNDIEEGR